MSEDYNRLQWSLQFNGENFCVRAQTGDDLKEGAQEIASNISDFHAASTVIRSAYGVAEAATVAKTDEVKTTQRKSFSRTVKPGASGGSECKHGKPWKDADGQMTKAGKPYAKRFYNTCNEKDPDCYAWGEQS